jgi:thiol reductant ABC exporter CydD subunit
VSDRVDRRLLRETRAARFPVAATGALGVVAAALVVAQAVLLARVVARVFLDGASVADVGGSLVALACVVVARGLVSGAFELTGRLGALRVMSELRARLARALLVSRPTGLPGTRAGELAGAVVQGVDALEAFFARYLPQVVLSAVVPIAVLAWVLPHDLPAGLILLVTLPLVPVFMILLGLRAQDDVAARERTLTLLGSHFLDVVRGLRTLRAFGREEAVAQTLGEVGERYRRETLATLRVAFLSALVLELLAMIGTALVAATVGIQLAQGHLGLSSGLAVLLLAPELYAPLRAMGAQHHAAADGMASAQRIFAVLDAPATVAPVRFPRVPPDPARSAIVLDGVSFAYAGVDGPAGGGGGAGGAGGRLVLDEASLTLAPGEIVALVGPSGAGKSTLGTLLLRLADPVAGEVRCGGVDIAELDPDAWRALVAWAPQRGRLFAGTIADNLRLGSPDADESLLWAALAVADAEELVRELPEGLATRVGGGGRTLSAGQTQRLVLARALVRVVPLLILDEPTASLDADSAARVAASLPDAVRGCTTLLITHDLGLAARADRVVELVDGRLVERSVAVLRRRIHAGVGPSGADMGVGEAAGLGCTGDCAAAGTCALPGRAA